MPFLWGYLEVVAVGGSITSSRFSHERLEEECHPSLTSLRRQLESYLDGGGVELGDVPIDLSACTPFQRRVYGMLRGVGWGRTITYGQLAQWVGCRSARAVGRALAANTHLLFVPCHRVVASRGLGGFSAGVSLKRALLKLEGGIHEGERASRATL